MRKKIKGSVKISKDEEKEIGATIEYEKEEGEGEEYKIGLEIKINLDKEE